MKSPPLPELNPSSHSLGPAALEVDSVAIPLSGSAWLSVILITLMLVIVIPSGWKRWEKFEPNETWRTSSAVAEDYWQWDRWADHAAQQGYILLIGDSVTWGEYAAPDQALAAQLNQLTNATRFANLGLQGLYPIAMNELLDVHSPQAAMLLHFNPLWLTSQRRDLSWDEEVPVNHALLLPQFDSRIKVYRPSWEDRFQRWTTLRWEAWRWRDHWRLDDLEGKDWATWSRQHPTQWPWQSFDGQVLEPENEPHSQVSPRRDRRAGDSSQESERRTRTYGWIEPESSLQYQAFLESIPAPQLSGKSVAVLIGQLNPEGRTVACLDHEARLREQLLARLKAIQVPAWVLPCSAEWMADASHPTPEGYRAQAQWLLDQADFRDWLETLETR